MEQKTKTAIVQAAQGAGDVKSDIWDFFFNDVIFSFNIIVLHSSSPVQRMQIIYMYM